MEAQGDYEIQYKKGFTIQTQALPKEGSMEKEFEDKRR